MPTRAAKDTSTLKAIATGGKMCKTCCDEGQEFKWSCGDCSSMGPNIVWITLADFEDCDCTDYGCAPLDQNSGKGTDIAAALPGIYYLRHLGGGTPLLGCSNNCGCQFQSDMSPPSFFNDHEGDFGDLETWTNHDSSCSGGSYTKLEFDRLRIEACLETSNNPGCTSTDRVRIGVFLADSTAGVYPALASYVEIFRGLITYVGGDSCGDTDEQAANARGPCKHENCPTFWFMGVSGGTAKIHLSDPCDDAIDWVELFQYYAHDFAIDPIDSKCYMANTDSQSTTRPELNSDWTLVEP